MPHLSEVDTVNREAIEKARVTRVQKSVEAGRPRLPDPLVADDFVDATEAPENLQSTPPPRKTIDQLFADVGGRTKAQITTQADKLFNRLVDEEFAPEPRSAFPELPVAAQSVSNLAFGVSDELAKLTGLVPEAVNEALMLLGKSLGADSDSLTFLDSPGDALKAVKKAFEAVGQRPMPELDNFERRVGRSAFTAGIIAATIQARAPVLALEEGVTLLSFIGKQLGEFALKHPGMFAATEAGAVVGAQFGGEEFGPTGAIVGGVVGGGLPAVVGSAGGGVLLSPVKAFKSLQEFYAIPKAARGEDPIFTPLEARTATFFAQRQVEGDMLMIDNSIKATINRVAKSSLSPAEAEIVLRRGLEKTLQVVLKIESKMFGRIPQKVRVSTKAIVAAADRMLQAPDIAPEVLPMTKINQILGSPNKDGVRPNLPTIGSERTVGDLGRLRSSILSLQREARADENCALVGNLGKLVASVDRSIKNGLPDSEVVDQARAFSKFRHDNFDRGPVGIALRYLSSGDPNVSPTQTATQLLKDFGGTGGVRGGGQFGTEQVVTGAAQAGRKKVVQQLETAIRTRFREAADEAASPELAGKAGEKFIRENAAGIKGLANLQNELNTVRKRLVNFQEQRDTITSSALAKFSTLDPDVAAAKIVASPNPAKDIKVLLKDFKGDEDAIEGLQNGIIENLFKSAAKDGEVTEGGHRGISGIILRNRLSDPKIDRMLEVLFANATEKMSRLRKITRIAAQLAEGRGRSAAFIRGAKVTAGVGGAFIGRALGVITGFGGTVQVPGIFAAEARRVVTDAVQQMDPAKMLRYAVNEPQWEKLLLTKIPTNPLETKRFLIDARRIVSTLEGSRKNLAFNDGADLPIPEGLDEFGPLGP